MSPALHAPIQAKRAPDAPLRARGKAHSVEWRRHTHMRSRWLPSVGSDAKGTGLISQRAHKRSRRRASDQRTPQLQNIMEQSMRALRAQVRTMWLVRRILEWLVRKILEHLRQPRPATKPS